MLQRYLNIADHKTAQQVHAFHVPLFTKFPGPLSRLATLSGVLVKRYPAAASLNSTTITDSCSSMNLSGADSFGDYMWNMQSISQDG